MRTDQVSTYYSGLEWLPGTSAGVGWPGTCPCGRSVSEYKIGDRGPTPQPQGVMCGLP
jgi:hypothetical protein